MSTDEIVLPAAKEPSQRSGLGVMGPSPRTREVPVPVPPPPVGLDALKRRRSPRGPLPGARPAPRPDGSGPGLPGAPAPNRRLRARPRHRLARRVKEVRPAAIQPTGPHIRFGILWGAITLGAMLLGVRWLAGWLAVVAALAAASGARSWGTAIVVQRQPHNRRARVQPPAAVAASLAGLVTLAALAGAWAVLLLAAAVAVALVIGATFGPLGQPDLVRRVVIVLGPAAAAAGLIVARTQGLAEGLVLAGMVTVFDSSAFLVGTGAPNHWEGVVAGVASIAALTLFVAAVLVPPFTGAMPWLLGGGAALLAPVGAALARWAVGDPTAPVPALKRLDSLILVGPAWAAGIALMLHR